MPPKQNYPKGRVGFPYFQGGKPLQMPTERRKRFTTLCFTEYTTAPHNARGAGGKIRRLLLQPLARAFHWGQRPSVRNIISVAPALDATYLWAMAPRVCLNWSFSMRRSMTALKSVAPVISKQPPMRRRS